MAFVIMGGPHSMDNSTWQTATAFNVTPASTTSYTLYVKTSSVCSASASNAAAVTVYAYPEISIQPAATSSVCSGGTVTLRVTASTSTPATRYAQWQQEPLSRSALRQELLIYLTLNLNIEHNNNK
jgi:hypothetical protein